MKARFFSSSSSSCAKSDRLKKPSSSPSTSMITLDGEANEDKRSHIETTQATDDFNSAGSWIETPTSSRPPTYISDVQSFNDSTSHTSSTNATDTLSARSSTSNLVHLRPPSVWSADEFQEPVTYTFVPTSPVSNSLTLLPPQGASEAIPRFHIVVTPNVFNPFSHLTSVYSGETQFGDWVASFEMGMSSIKSRVRIHKRDRLVKNVLEKNGPRNKALWTWRSPSPDKTIEPFTWDLRGGPSTPIVCRSTDAKKTILATYSSARSMLPFPASISINTRGQEDQLSRLEVTDAGQHIIEDILISLLIVERRRMLPVDDQQSKFN